MILWFSPTPFPIPIRKESFKYVKENSFFKKLIKKKKIKAFAMQKEKEFLSTTSKLFPILIGSTNLIPHDRKVFDGWCPQFGSL